MAAQSLGAPAPVVFNFTPSFSVRIAVCDGDPWFCAADVCDVLGYTNSRKAIADHCRGGGVTKRDTPTESGVQALTFLSEGNLYRLIIKSRKPEAQRFESWVCDEVLPSIRKTGAYAAPGAVVANQQFSEADQKNLQRLVWAICDRFHTASAWKQVVWNALRQAAQHPAPLRFETRHIPPLAEELKRILEIAEAVSTHSIAIEKEAVRRIFRYREDVQPFVDELAAEEARWLNAVREWPRQIADYRLNDLGRFALRCPPCGSDHSAYAEPARRAA